MKVSKLTGRIPVIASILPGRKAENEVELIIRGLAKSFKSQALKEVFYFTK